MTSSNQVPTLSINNQDWDMLTRGEKWVLFTDEINDVFKAIVDEELLFEKIQLQDNKTGKLLGEATILFIYSLMYNVKTEGGLFIESGVHLPTFRNKAIKAIYFEWCARRGIKANLNEGWFKSKKFSSYLDKINWGGNYAIFLCNVNEFEK